MLWYNQLAYMLRRAVNLLFVTPGKAVKIIHGKNTRGEKQMKKFISAILVLCFMLTPFVSVPVPKASAADYSSKAGRVATAGDNLNVRKTASASAEKLTNLRNGTEITLISKSGSWWKVEYAKDKYGYSHADYIKTVSSTPAQVKISSGYLNVRSGAGTSYAVKDTLLKGETVLVLSSGSSWSRILYHGTKTGYVKEDYLSLQGSSSVAYPAVKLSVPSYKQTDSRWANVKIGSSGKTIAQIGCATTAIAMIESYRSGKTIYPDAMSKKLSYSSSGSVYWPSDYKAVTSSSGYLAKIYNYLREGKPVLLGAKNSYGTQHWVVITGYKGGDSLTASGFTINDPGSSSRVTLQQFLGSYPTFYKYFYY